MSSMKQTEHNRIIAKHYKTLRNYLKDALDTSVTVLEGDIAQELGLSDKSVQSMSRGNRAFSWVEAKTIAMFLIKQCEKNEDIDKTVCKRLLSAFLLSCAHADQNSEADHNTVNKLLAPYFGTDSNENSRMKHPVNGFSNLPQWARGNTIIRNHYLDDIKKGAEANQILFLSGFPGTGKSFIAVAAVDSFTNDLAGGYRYVIWNSATSKTKLSFNDLLTNILNAFHFSNTANLSHSEKVECTVKCLSTERAAIVVDGFEHIDASEQRDILIFLADRAPRNDLVIVTSDVRFSSFKDMRQYVGRFHEIEVDKFNYKEWKTLASKLGASQNDILMAMRNCPELIEYIYTLGKGNLKFMLHGLASAAGKLLEGISFDKIKTYHLPDLVSGSYELALERSFEDLADNDRCLLAALSLFAAPVPLNVLSPVSGLGGIDSDGNLQEDSVLAKSISKCRDLYLLDSDCSNGRATFSLSMMQPIMDSELKKNRSRYENIIERWLNHYIQLTNDMGLCYNDFFKLNLLDTDRDIDNIRALLDFCDREQRWQEFYTVSENTRYYFYTRGISGQGKNSIHYRRAYAAQILGRPVDEFTSLLYHCNVASKTKSQEGIDECFDRLDKLQKSTPDIPALDQLKYRYVRALYTFSMGNYVDAHGIFEEYESEVAKIIKDGREIFLDKMTLHDYCASLRWHSECLYSLADNETDKDKLFDITDKVDALLDKALELAEKTNFDRATVHSKLIRTKFYYYLLSDRDRAQEVFRTLKPYEQVIEKDASYRQTYYLLQGKLLKE